jgi:phage antirepressor YoqD-like protein
MGNPATRLHQRVACSNLLFPTIAMLQIRHERRQKLIEQEGRIEFAIQAIKNHTITSIREAARVFDVPRTTLQDRLKGVIHKPIQRPNIIKLNPIEKDSLEN